MATQPSDRFARFVNTTDYNFATVETTGNVKALESSGIAYQNLVDIQGQYKIRGSKEHEKDSLVHLAEAIIDPYYRNMRIRATRISVPRTRPRWRNSTKLTSCT